MIRQEPSWELYRAFLEVVRNQSLSGAARRLGLTQPTVGRQIEALETALGLALFTRSPRGLIPTAAAHDLVAHVEAMAAANAALLRAASGEAAAEGGTVRLAASEFMGCEILPKILADFRNAQKTIDLELVLSNRLEDLLLRQADIAVRMMRPTQSQLVTKKIGKVSLGLYAHRTYVELNGLPQTVEGLAEHCWIGFDRDDHSFRSVGREALDATRSMFGFRCDSDVAQLAALRAGVGIGGCQDNVAKKNPDLIPVLPDLRFELEIWLAMHEDLRTTRRIRLLFDHLAEGLARYVAGA
ncbi:MAG: LysR family transcriptional regulator [Beijerinckiaceae bacterium]